MVRDMLFDEDLIKFAQNLKSSIELSGQPDLSIGDGSSLSYRTGMKLAGDELRQLSEKWMNERRAVGQQAVDDLLSS